MGGALKVTVPVCQIQTPPYQPPQMCGTHCLPFVRFDLQSTASLLPYIRGLIPLWWDAVVADWEREHGIPPGTADLPVLLQHASLIESAVGIEKSVFSPELLRQWLAGASGELAPVNAVRSTRPISTFYIVLCVRSIVSASRFQLVVCHLCGTLQSTTRNVMP